MHLAFLLENVQEVFVAQQNCHCSVENYFQLQCGNQAQRGHPVAGLLARSIFFLERKKFKEFATTPWLEEKSARISARNLTRAGNIPQIAIWNMEYLAEPDIPLNGLPKRVILVWQPIFGTISKGGIALFRPCAKPGPKPKNGPHTAARFERDEQRQDLMYYDWTQVFDYMEDNKADSQKQVVAYFATRPDAEGGKLSFTQSALEPEFQFSKEALDAVTFLQKIVDHQPELDMALPLVGQLTKFALHWPRKWRKQSGRPPIFLRVQYSFMLVASGTPYEPKNMREVETNHFGDCTSGEPAARTCTGWKQKTMAPGVADRAWWRKAKDSREKGRPPSQVDREQHRRRWGKDRQGGSYM
ncbi:hypothetical protein K438DRAFT_1773771 [Mycena galopus ATCC 62051]|nr:hypothetical protein K438DRAFT_1773771 [Mycena galopus ATCC 62051]